MTTTQAIDQQKAEAFAGQMANILNGGCLAMMTSVGHRTGLFNKMASLPPSTSEQISGAAGLNERYVREWLGAMASAGIVEYDPAGRTFRLPAEHAASLTEAAGPANMATMMQFFALFGQTEDDLVECFRRGGGVPYSRFTKFQQLMAEESAQVVDATLIQTTLPLIPGMVARLESGIDVLDVGCGKGHAINVMARTYPNSRFTGYDFSEEGIAAGMAEAREMGLANARFVKKDVATIEERAAFDFITAFDSIHDQAQPRRVLKGISDALRPDGAFLMVDIAASSNLHENLEHPLAPMLYSVSTMHCMTVSLALGGEGLGTVWGEQLAMELLKDAGFTAIDVKSVEGDIMNAYYICTKG